MHIHTSNINAYISIFLSIQMQHNTHYFTSFFFSFNKYLPYITPYQYCFPHSFFYNCTIFHYLDEPQFTYPVFHNEHSGCFQCFATVNNASIHYFTSIQHSSFQFSISEIPRYGTWVKEVCTFKILTDAVKLSSTNTVPIHNPTSNV